MKVKHLNGGGVEFIHVHGGGRATFMDGIPCIAWLHGCWVAGPQQGKGFGDLYHRDRLMWLKEEGYCTSVMCSVAMNNVAQNKIMRKNGWQICYSDPQMSVNVWHRLL